MKFGTMLMDIMIRKVCHSEGFGPSQQCWGQVSGYQYTSAIVNFMGQPDGPQGPRHLAKYPGCVHEGISG